MPGQTRRYSLRVEGQTALVDPAVVREELGLSGERFYNPGGLKAGAIAVAVAAISRDERLVVEVVKHLATGDRVETSINAWDVRASRAIGR